MPVGVNRVLLLPEIRWLMRCPHARGGEPLVWSAIAIA